jgi:hypothetical protein
MYQPNVTPWGWNELRWWLYERAPVVLEDAAKKGLPFVLPWCTLSMPVVLLRGPSRYSGQPWTVLMAGAHHAIDNIAHRYFACPPQRETVGSLPLWRVSATLQRLGASVDLVIAYVDRLSARLFFRSNYLRVPESVGSWLAVPDDLNKLKRTNRSVKADLRRIRREQFTFTVSHAEEDCETFYHTMYVPYLRKRHGELAVIRSLPQVRCIFRRGGVFWVLCEGQRIAGQLFSQRDGVLSCVGMGMADGDPSLLRKGAIAATYFFSLQYAQSQGLTRIDLGGSPPALSDGLLRYKRKWGARLTAKPQTPYDYLLWWRRPTEQIIALLAHRQLIFRKAGQWAAVTALDPGCVATPELVHKLHRSLSMPGLRRLVILSSGGEGGNGLGGPQLLQPSREEGESEVVFCPTDRFLREFGGVE